MVIDIFIATATILFSFICFVWHLNAHNSIGCFEQKFAIRWHFFVILLFLLWIESQICARFIGSLINTHTAASAAAAAHVQ